MKAKIEIQDNQELRKEILDLTHKLDQKELAKWSIEVATHILDILEINYSIDSKLNKIMSVSELLQKNKANVSEVREASFKIHKLAKTAPTPVYEAAFRTLGHAIATGHVSEHAIIASDYAIKCIELLSDEKKDTSIPIIKERKWQLEKLKLTCKKTC